jgi:hypothetical protein
VVPSLADGPGAACGRRLAYELVNRAEREPTLVQQRRASERRDVERRGPSGRADGAADAARQCRGPRRVHLLGRFKGPLASSGTTVITRDGGPGCRGPR